MKYVEISSEYVNDNMADGTESETETESETSEENKAQTSLPTTSKSSCRKFTGAARYKSTFQNEWAVKYKNFFVKSPVIYTPFIVMFARNK